MDVEMDSPNTEWSNDLTLLFLELYKDEEALWNSKNKFHKNKNVLADSWERIRRKLEIETITVADLKKKKESLMTTYRYHSKKIKNSTKSGAGVEEIYQTNWFAFQTMDSFLRQIYDCKPIITTERKLESNETSTNEPREPEEQRQQERQQQTGQQQSGQQQTGQQGQQQKQKKIVNKTSSAQNIELQQVKKQMNNAYEIMTEATKRQELDETDYFCHMLAKKLKKMPDEERDKLIFDIHALTYNTTYSIRPQTRISNSSSSYIDLVHTPSPNQGSNNCLDNQYGYNYGASTSTSHPIVAPVNKGSTNTQITILSQDIIQQAYQLADDDETQFIGDE